MTFAIKVTPQAEEDLSRLDKTIAQNISNKIEWLSQNIENIIPSPLKGKFKGKYKLRVGDWRGYIPLNMQLRLLLYMQSDIAVKYIKYEPTLLHHPCLTPSENKPCLNFLTGLSKSLPQKSTHPFIPS